MKAWPVQDAKARFSQMLETCLHDGPQIVTRRGVEEAVLVSLHDWRQLQSGPRPTLKDLLMMEEGRGEMNIPPRGTWRQGTPPDLD